MRSKLSHGTIPSHFFPNSPYSLGTADIVSHAEPTEDEVDKLGVNSTMEYLSGLGVNPENAEVFVAMELLKAPNFGEIQRKGFVDGWSEAG